MTNSIIVLIRSALVNNQLQSKGVMKYSLTEGVQYVHSTNQKTYQSKTNP
jgi:hypothetical protein